MSLAFAVEPLEHCWSAIYDKPDGLAYQHWCETQQHRHGQGYNPLFERYNQYAKAGWFVQFTVRDDGRMVGYAGVYLVPSMHSQQLVSVEDTWYLLPEYRKGWNAIKFYRHMENACKAMGAVEATLTLPVTKDLGPILKRLGYSPVSEQYSKNLIFSAACDSVPPVTQHRADSAQTVPHVAAVKEGANEAQIQ